MGVHESLRSNESKSGLEFKIFESARESVGVKEILRPSKSESSKCNQFSKFEQTQTIRERKRIAESA